MVKLKAITDYLIVALCGSIAMFVKDTFQFVGIYAFLIIPLAATISYFILSTFFDTLWISHFFRKFRDERARYEGNWIDKVERDDGMCYYGLISTKYISENDSYSQYGACYSEKGEYYGKWDSLSIGYDHDFKEMHCVYKADIKKYKEPIFGYSYYSLHDYFGEKNSLHDYFWGKKYNCGTGFYLDIGADRLCLFYSFERLAKELKKELIGDEDIDTALGRKHFIIAYHKKYGHSNKSSVKTQIEVNGF